MSLPLQPLFAEALQANVPLAPYTSARIGGPADQLLICRSGQSLRDALQTCWRNQIPFTLLGGGSNVLVSDLGIRGLVIINKAKETRLVPGQQPRAWAESGVNFGRFCHQLAEAGLSGLEWGATVPGTVGGAVYGNAGAYGGDIAGSLAFATLITPDGELTCYAGQMGYAYRSSVLKRGELKAVILAAEFNLKNDDPASIKNTIDILTTKRRASQPPGASMGSMFKNPEGDHAGRLIEACGLKGTRVGNAEISPVHGNFIVNHGNTLAADVKALIDLAREAVQQKFGISLHLEVEMIGEWK